MIRTQLEWDNLKYYLENIMPGKYCVRERAYVDEDYEECEGCNLLCEVKK